MDPRPASLGDTACAELVKGALEKIRALVLRLAREKRDLANSIVVRARRLEEQDQFSEALGQSERLRAATELDPRVTGVPSTKGSL